MEHAHVFKWAGLSLDAMLKKVLASKRLTFKWSSLAGVVCLSGSFVINTRNMASPPDTVAMLQCLAPLKFRMLQEIPEHKALEAVPGSLNYNSQPTALLCTLRPKENI